jgi:hypothetical protein
MRNAHGLETSGLSDEQMDSVADRIDDAWEVTKRIAAVMYLGIPVDWTPKIKSVPQKCRASRRSHNA